MSKAKLLPDCIFNRPTDLRAAQRLLSFRAHAIQAITLDLIIDRSSSAKTVAICIMARPNGPVASMPCCSPISATPAASSSAIACAMYRTERPKRSIDQTKQISNRRRMASLSIWSVLVAGLPPVIR